MGILVLKSDALNYHTSICQPHEDSESLRHLSLFLFAWQIPIASSHCKDVYTKLVLPKSLCDATMFSPPSVSALHLEKPLHRNECGYFLTSSNLSL